MVKTKSSVVLVQKRGPVTRIVLNNAPRLNAIDSEMASALLAALKDVGDDPACRCLSITGSGRSFSAGQALPAHHGGEELPRDIARLIRTSYIPIISQIRALGIPVVADVNGLATGAGFALALAADIRLASQAAWFSCGYAAIGLVPDAGCSYFLSRYLGLPKALEIALTGRRIQALEAQSLGLVASVFSERAFTDECLAFARRLAAGPTRAYALTKRALSLGLVHTLDEQMELEASLQQEASETDDFREGVASFRDRRTPHFTGR
ncbi:MAG TPA: enoyl-CoA hydratase-related protein [Candidatus Dormibacteraeota bacterium]|nr:enoyl-CoA hydratase-related protein [Candidatus Dormibacteraeota bacterium]